MIVDIIAGTIGGISVVLVGHPFDTTKTRLQTAPSGFYKNTLDCVKKTIQWEGFKGFYKGVFSPLSGQMFFRACSFTTFYSSVKLLKQSEDEQLSAFKLMLAGGFTGLVISFIECPIDLVKTRLQVQIFQQQINPSYVPKYTNVKNCVSYLYHKYGMQSLWRGLSATLIRNIPANALFFPVNEVVKRYFVERDHLRSSKDLPLSHNLIAGASAGLCYWVGTYPLDVVKAKMQSSVASPVGWLETVRSLYRSEGMSAFGRGLLPCALRAIPACGSMFATVDFIRHQLS